MTIWIYGDVALDNYEYEHPGGFPKAYKEGLGLTEHPYPELSGRIRNRFVVRKFGGAHLLARFVAIAMAVWNKRVPGDRKDLDADTTRKGLHQLPPWAQYRDTLYRMQEDLAKHPTDFEDILNFFYRVSKDPDNAYRMQPGGYEGYTLPMQLQKDQARFRCLLASGNGNTAPKKPVDRPIELSDAYNQATMCVFNDGGTRLQREDPSWLQSEPWALKPDINNTWAVLKLHEPNLSAVCAGGAQSPFLKQLYKLLPGRVILVMSADDLRRNDAAVSRSLSWERSVRDLVELIEKTTTVEADVIRHVVITFDYDAALYLRTSVSNGNNSVQKAILVFSTSSSEGEYQSQFDGSMPGAQTVFTSVLAGLIHAHFAADPSSSPNEATDGPLHGEDTLIEKILTYALIAKQQMLRFGFESVTDDNMFTSINHKNWQSDNSSIVAEFDVS